MKIALMRHPKPAIEPGICYGRLDVAADPLPPGREAEPAFRGAAHVWTSPARRCLMPAQAVALALCIPLFIDKRLQELDFGAWEGHPWDAIARADLDRWAASPLAFAPPGGESGAALIARVRDFHAGLCRDQQDCIVVSHGGPLKILAAFLLGMPPDLLAAPPPLASIRVLTSISAKTERRYAGHDALPE